MVKQNGTKSEAENKLLVVMDYGTAARFAMPKPPATTGTGFATTLLICYFVINHYSY